MTKLSQLKTLYSHLRLEIQLHSSHYADSNLHAMVLKINLLPSLPHLLQFILCKRLSIDSLSLHLVTRPEKPAPRKTQKKRKRKMARLIWVREVMLRRSPSHDRIQVTRKGTTRKIRRSELR